jgi:hypothetical protein
MSTLRWTSYPALKEGDVIVLEVQRPGYPLPLIGIVQPIGPRPDFPIEAAERIVANAWQGLEEMRKRPRRGRPHRPINLALEMYGEQQRGMTVGRLCEKYEFYDEKTVQRYLSDARRLLRAIEKAQSRSPE